MDKFGDHSKLVKSTEIIKPPKPQEFDLLNQKMPSNPGSDKSDALQRLEVATTSSTSLPISFPYYYIHNINNSFDTFNILNSGDNPINEPLYSNTSHNLTKSEHYRTTPPDVSSPEKISDETHQFNQVPPRFSQFITEQQGHQRSVHDTSNSSSLGTESNGPLRRKSHSTLATNRVLRTKNSPGSLGRMSGDRFALNRQISESMGSQATIFSTRLGSDKNTKGYGSDENSLLARRKAIKFKQGGALYRIKLRLQKLLKRFKKLKFITKVSSKRMSLRKKPSMKKTLQISVPMTNPQLGQAKVQIESSKSNNRSSKSNQLSEFIDQQQNLYLRNLDGKTKSINYKSDSHRKPKITKTFDDIEEVPVSETSSAPPPLPPHHGNTTIISDYNDMVELWRKYLVHVLYKRIQLRQEIGLYQTMLANQELKTRQLSVGSAVNGIYAIDEHQDSETGSTTMSTSSHDTNDSNDTADTISETGTLSDYDHPKVIHHFVLDTDTEKFNRKYANRQSVLGEMLDYSSDDDLTTSGSKTTITNSTTDGNIHIKPTKVNHRRLTRSFSSPSSHKHSHMKRSDGYSVRLNMAY